MRWPGKKAVDADSDAAWAVARVADTAGASDVTFESATFGMPMK
jgi:hypothetical protein